VLISGLRILSQTPYVEYIPKAPVRFRLSLGGNTKEVPGDKVAGETFCLTSAAIDCDRTMMDTALRPPALVIPGPSKVKPNTPIVFSLLLRV
jgi:hypothetical protein